MWDDEMKCTLKMFVTYEWNVVVGIHINNKYLHCIAAICRGYCAVFSESVSIHFSFEPTFTATAIPRSHCH